MTERTYSRLQRRLHWVVVFLVVAETFLRSGIERAFDLGLETGVFEMTSVVLAHFLIGTLVLALVLLRLIALHERGLPSTTGAISTLAHSLLYGLLIVVPMTGVLAWGIGSATLGWLHWLFNVLLYALAIAHVVALVFQHFVLKNKVLNRMFIDGPED